jgi:hypothetical protein
MQLSYIFLKIINSCFVMAKKVEKAKLPTPIFIAMIQ